MVDIEVVDVDEGSTVAGVAGNIVAEVAGNIVAVIVGKIVAETENAVRCCCMQDSAAGIGGIRLFRALEATLLFFGL